MRKRREGLNLGEKIEKELEKVKKKGVVSHMTDTFYEMVEENGSNFYLRRTNLLREGGRLLNIVDEIEVQEKEERAQREIEAARDITFEEFKDKFMDHINGTAENQRSAHDSAEEEEDPGKKSAKKGSKSQRNTDMNKTHSNIDGDDAEERKSSISGVRSNNMSKSRTDMNFSTDNFKYEIPESCILGMMKKVLIEKMDMKYFLVSHPYPQVEGQMMIFQPKKADQKDSDIIPYRDFSLRKRIETSMKTK